MKSRQYGLNLKAPGNQLCVSDIIQYLLGLARLYRENRTGNLDLSEGLRDLAQALRPYADCRVSELPKALRRTALPDVGIAVSTADNLTLPIQLEYMEQSDIKRILDDASYTKQQIIELGVQRFGISKSRLDRLRKQDALETVRAALEHEQSLDVISSEARRGGSKRSN